MIVKNESHVIQRCLRSVKPYIDSYSISDTGSTDNTMELIREELAGIPGVLTSDPWKDFATNRNIALQGVRGDWVFSIDADETFEIDGRSLVIDPKTDLYWVQIREKSTVFWRQNIFRNDGRWHYQNPIHEALCCDGSFTEGQLEGAWINTYYDSARNQAGGKAESDLAVLEKEPRTARTLFYLGQLYLNLGRLPEAEAMYRQRSTMGGWDEEVYFSLYEVGHIAAALGKPLHEAAGALYAAYTFRPHRLEALVELCALLRTNQRYQESYNLSLISPPRSTDLMFVNPHSEWMLLDEHGLAAYYLDKKDEAREYFLRVARYDLPASDRERTQMNLSYCPVELSIS